MNTIDTHTKEQQFSNLVRSYRKEYVGKGPNSIRVSFKDNWAIAHMTGVLSKVESFYPNDKRNESMLHYTRTEKIKQMYKEIDVNEMESVVGAKFVKLFTDIDLNDDEVISIFVFDKSIE
ncbi:Putative cytosolic protein [Staphylococcus aureus]|nr:Putative cytosolic protein [Staphylococcus aureus]